MPPKTETEAGSDASMEVAKNGDGVDNEKSDSTPVREGTHIIQSVNQVKEEATSQVGSLVSEVIREESLEAGTNEQQDQMAEKRLKANGTFIMEFGSCVIVFGVSELLGIISLPTDSLKKLPLVSLAMLASFTLISGLCLLIHTIIFMLEPGNTITRPIHQTISKVFIIMSCASLLLSSLTPLCLLPQPYNLLILVMLVPISVTIGVPLYLGTKTFDKKREEDQIEYEEHKKEIPRVFDLIQANLSLSTGGLFGLLFDAHQNASNLGHHPVVLVIIFLILTSFIVSTILMFICQMRLLHLSSTARENFLRIAAGFSKFLLFLLAITTLCVAFTFLKLYVVTVFLPVSIVYVVWHYIASCTRDHQQHQHILEEEDLKLTYTKAKEVTSLSFGGIMAIFSTVYLGSDEKKMHLNLCIFFLASDFLVGLSLMMLSYNYKPPKRLHIGLVVSMLSVFGHLLLFAAFTTFILEFVRGL